jgi:excisionase family DNA binding protein
MDKLLYTPEEAAYLLGISRSSIFKMFADGSLPTIKIGRSTRVALSTLQGFVEQLEHGLTV